MSYENILPSYEAARLSQAVQDQQDTQLAWITVAASIGGGLVAAFMAARDGKSIVHSLFALIAGISFGIFGGPFISDKLGMTSTKDTLFVHFLAGLLGSVLADKISSHSGEISQWVIDKTLTLFRTAKVVLPTPPVIRKVDDAKS